MCIDREWKTRTFSSSMKNHIWIVALAAVLLGGCSKPAPTADPRFDSLKVGMTIEEVEKIMGKPSAKVDSLQGYMLFWNLESGESIGITTDNDGKVTSTSRKAK
jgi:hypothetical protein